MPAARRPRISSHASRRALGSNPVVGSSRNSSSGLADQPQRQVQPPLLAAGQVPDLLPLLPGQPDQADHLVDVARRRVVAGVAGDGLPDGQVRLDRDVLQHQPDPLAQRPAGGPVAGSRPSTVDPAGVRGPESLENLQRGGLARAVRPEQREDLAVPRR